MPERTVEDRLREEYFDLLPDIRHVVEHMKAETRHRLLAISGRLDKHEQIKVDSRIKECESALDKLRRREQGRIFDQEKSYTLKDLKDLAGVRVLVFPRSRLEEIDIALRPIFESRTADPILGDGGETLALKYWGYCPEASSKVPGEYQIVPMLTGLFWTVEHSAIYKPSPRYKDAVRTPQMQALRQKVLEALGAFEEEFERLVRDEKS